MFSTRFTDAFEGASTKWRLSMSQLEVAAGITAIKQQEVYPRFDSYKQDLNNNLLYRFYVAPPPTMPAGCTRQDGKSVSHT